jgi:hypothetical protein
MTTELDMNPRFDVTMALAAMNRGGPAALPSLDPAEVRCPRALASNRLFVRRWAARRQRPGEHWNYLETIDLVDDELARMGCSAEEARGCGLAACVVCNPRACNRCGGLVGGACEVPA